VPPSPIGNAQKSLSQERDRWFESIFLQRGVWCEPDFRGRAPTSEPAGNARGDLSTALSWYRRARDLGVAEAEILLKSLETK
jgi:TPR repeat protein